MAVPRYKKGAPSVAPGEQQLQQGEAKQLNEMADSPEAKAAVDNTPPVGIQFDAAPRQPAGRLSDDEAMLAGPTSRPGEPVNAPVTQNGVIPQAILDGLPALLRAAQDPQAPPAVHALVRLLSSELG